MTSFVRRILWILITIDISKDFTYTWSSPPKKHIMSPEKGPFYKEMSSSNHQFSMDMAVFRGLNDYNLQVILMTILLEEIATGNV